jgi:cytoskeletal protein CcmA (bactofilin family)
MDSSCSRYNLYFSTTGTSYVQINKDTFTAGPGTVSISSGSATVTGTSTTFTTSFSVNDDIKIDGNFL